MRSKVRNKRGGGRERGTGDGETEGDKERETQRDLPHRPGTPKKKKTELFLMTGIMQVA